MGGSESRPAPPSAPKEQGQCPVQHTPTAVPAEAGNGCPHHANAAKSGAVYNVYSQPINPANRMPSNPNQEPAPGQEKPLSTSRQQSTIPKGGTEGTWLYPSPQMFYNALVRKGKAEGVTEDDMGVVVAIHNAMNERTWQQLLHWEESLHKSELAPECPRLRRFQGRPYELSPKARIKSWLGYGYPFDRHDWYVDRGDGVERRYVIDYYFDTEANEKAESMDESMKAIHVDVRPALDSVGSVWDRLVQFPMRAWEGFRRPRVYCDGLDPRKMPREMQLAMREGDVPAGAEGSHHEGMVAVGEPVPSPVLPKEVLEAKELVSNVQRKCEALRARLESAETDEERSNAYVAFTYCVGTLACPEASNQFMQAMEKGAEGEGGDQKAFQGMSECVVERMQSAYRTMRSVEEAANTER